MSDPDKKKVRTKIGIIQEPKWALCKNQNGLPPTKMIPKMVPMKNCYIHLPSLISCGPYEIRRRKFKFTLIIPKMVLFYNIHHHHSDQHAGKKCGEMMGNRHLRGMEIKNTFFRIKQKGEGGH